MEDIKKLQDLIRARRKDMQELKKRRAFFQRGPVKVEGILNTIFKDNSEISKKIEESRALTAWSTLVGSAAAQSSSAIRINNGVMLVKVADGLWMQQLLLLKQSLLKKYRETFPNLKLSDIYFSRG